jgi:very-short-patch-repair endonuclease
MRLPANDPPSESPIATAIELQLCKHDLKDTEFRREYPAPTEWADFRIDIVLANNGRRVGIECDGAAFHNEFRDELRDSLILGSGLVDTIWRLPGSDIHNHIHDCLCLISLYDDFVFDDRSRTVFRSQCSEAVRAHSPEPAESILLSVDHDRLPTRGGFIDLRRRTRSDRYCPPRQHWRHLYEFALKHREVRFSELHAIRLAEQSMS